LRRLANSLKANYVAFARGLVSIKDSILFRTKFGNHLKFAQLFNYSKFMMNEEAISLANASHLLGKENLCYKNFYALSSNLIFFWCKMQNEKFEMVVLNKKGDLIRSKEVNQRYNGDKPSFDIKVNATNIIALKKFDNLVEIYNFNLELVHSFQVFIDKYENYDTLILNNYEIAFSDCRNNSITCFNYKTFNTKMNKIEFNPKKLNEQMGKNPRFVLILGLDSLNEKFLFFSGGHPSKTTGGMSPDGLTKWLFIILNREDDNNLYKWFYANSWLFYNTEFCYRFRSEIFIQDTYLSNKDVNPEEIFDNFDDFADMYSITDYKSIYSRKFFKHNLTLKFNKY